MLYLCVCLCLCMIYISKNLEYKAEMMEKDVLDDHYDSQRKETLGKYH